MSELDDVLAALEASDGREVALATVVAVRGSTYRREGARLVVPAGDGPTVGNISGGCLEGDVATKAREVLETGRPVLVSFDLTADDEAVWGWGLGCNGAIDVFVEPAREAARFAAAMRAAIAEQRPLALATVVAGEPLGARMVVHGDGRREGSLGDPAADGEVADAAAVALHEGRSGTVTLASGGRVFVEVLAPPLRLVVSGAGHDALPLVAFGARLGWRVEVVDDRRAMLTESRFPQASRLVHAQPGDAAIAAAVDDRTYVVVMSHNFLRDKAYLQSFLASGVPYLGVLGPGARLRRLLDELRAEGVAVDPADLGVVHGPAGLDLGAEGPEEIAWAIVAEILAVSRGAGAGMLRDRAGPIHSRRPAVGARA